MHASPRPKSLRPKQQLFAILSLLLQDMESVLGQVVGDHVVADHLSPTAPMPFQLSFVIAAHSTRPENALQVNYGPRIFCDFSLPEFSHSLSLDRSAGSIFLNLI